MQNEKIAFVGKRYLPQKASGIKQYISYFLEAGRVQMPADVRIYISYIKGGQGFYNKIKVKAGDIVAFGLNKRPLIGFSENMSQFIIEMNYLLFYQITGVFPMVCGQVIKFEGSDSLNLLANKLSQLPFEEWIKTTEDFIEKALIKNVYKSEVKIERILYVSNKIKAGAYDNLSSITATLNVSSRQMERDFKTFLGMTPKEYERIVRFYRALEHLQYEKMDKAAINSGYWDVSHMAKEFKRLSNWTPIEVLEHEHLFLNKQKPDSRINLNLSNINS